MKKVYLASWFANRDVMRQRADDLRQLGIEVTARWIAETIKKDAQTEEVPDDYLRETARVDIEDILRADTVILNVPGPEDLNIGQVTLSMWARGGRHFEAGFQYATMMLFNYLPGTLQDVGERRLILIGHRENVFHFLDGVQSLKALGFNLPKIELFNTWNDALTQFIAEKQL